jgi:DNA-binding NtrC family response regulator
MTMLVPANNVGLEAALAIEYRFPRPGGIKRALAEIEAELIGTALNQNGGNKRRTAIALGISRYALERRLVRIEKTLAAPTASPS